MNALLARTFSAAALLAAGMALAAPPVVLVRVHFDEGSDVLKDSATERLAQALPVLMAEYQFQRIEVAGHADTSGGPDANMDLSRRRAQAVFDYLAAQGMRMDLVSIRAYGETQLRSAEVDDESRAQNRRVELRLLDNPEPGNFSFPAE